MKESRHGRRRVVSNLWQYLTHPSDSQWSERQRLNAELLVLLTIIGFVLGIPLGLMPTLLGESVAFTQSATWVIVPLTIPAGLVGYYLNRRGYIQFASWYIILNAIFALYAGMLYEAPRSGVLTLYYLVVPLYLSTLFFSAASVLLVTALCLLLYLSFPLLIPSISYGEMLNGPVRLLILSSAFVALYCRFRDTLAARRQSSVRRREAQQRLLLETAFDGAILHEDWQIREISEAGAAMLGYQAEELEGVSFMDLLAPESVRRLDLQSSGTFTIEANARHRKGQKIVLELVSRQQRVDKQQIGFIAFRDITDRKERQRISEVIQAFSAAMRQADTRTELPPVILDNLILLLPVESAALYVVSEQDGVALEMMRGLGHPDRYGPPLEETIVGKAVSCPDSFHYDDSEQFLSPAAGSASFHMAVSLRRNEVMVGVLWLARDASFTDADRELLSQVTPMIAAALERSGRHAATKDYAQELELRVAERTQALVEANEQLKALDKLKSKFVSDVSHELRTPVTNLSLYLELLEKGNPEKRQTYMARLNNQTERLRKLLEDILNLSRLELGAAKPELGPVELGELLQDSLPTHQAKADAVGLTLRFEPATMPAVALGERNQLIQVIDNLVANSLNYTDRGSVVVSAVTESETGRVGIRVADTGRGIVAKDLPYVVDRFYRGQSTDQSNVPGTGLGLAIVSEIVTIHKGELVIESKDGEGTVVTVWLQPAQLPIAEPTGG